MDHAGMKQSFGERLFIIFDYLFMVGLGLLFLYPFWHILMYTLSDFTRYSTDGVFLWPRGFDTTVYRMMLKNGGSIFNGYKVSLIVTLFGTVLGTFFTATTAYPLAKTQLKGRSYLLFVVFFTMLFSGGMVPTYLLVKSLHMMDTYQALILPGMISAFNVIIMRNFFAVLPVELEEAARIDGASDLTVFFQIVLPLSKAVLATIALFYAVGFWNDFFSAILFIQDKQSTMWPLATVLRDMLNRVNEQTFSQGFRMIDTSSVNSAKVRMAVIFVSTLPILITYPFAQRYFVKGVMIGSLKG